MVARCALAACALVCVTLGSCVAPAPAPRTHAPDADDAAAMARGAEYLEARARAWLEKPWDFVNTDDHTCALSCHTTIPYVLASAAQTHGDGALPALATKVSDRARRWQTLPPYYDFAKETSRATEAAVSAAVLAVLESSSGRREPSPLLLDATANALAQLGPDGDWAWMQEDLSPFEDEAAHYWGNAFVAYALASAPGGLDGRTAPLVAYLKRRFAGQNLHARMMAVRAAAKIDGLLTADQVKGVKREVLGAKLDDGSWSMAALGTFRTKGGEPIDARSRSGDAYATGLAILTLLDAGVRRDDPTIVTARGWLLSHQDATGAWSTKSLNRPGTRLNDTLITDAATAYAVMGIAATHESASIKRAR